MGFLGWVGGFITVQNFNVGLAVFNTYSAWWKEKLLCFLDIGHGKYDIIFIALLIFVPYAYKDITALMTPSDQWSEGMQYRYVQKSADDQHSKS